MRKGCYASTVLKYAVYIQQPNTGCFWDTSNWHMLFTYVKTIVQLEPSPTGTNKGSQRYFQWTDNSEQNITDYLCLRQKCFQYVECYLARAAGNMLYNPLAVAPGIVVAWVFVCSMLADAQLLFCQSMPFTWMQHLGTSPVTSRKITSFPTWITGRHVSFMTARQFIGNVSQTQITTKIQPHFCSICIA